MDYFFGKKPDVKEQQRENDRALRKAGREIERERRELEREEKKVEMEIRKLAAEGNTEACKLLAKQLIQMRKQKNRTYAANSKIQSIGVQNKAMGNNMKLADAMGSAATSMRNINAISRPEQIAADMRAFSQATVTMDMTEDMINDTLDDMLEESGDEEESDLIINKVLDEIGIEMCGQMSKAPTATREHLGETARAKLPSDEEIKAHLAKLRS